MFMLIIVAVFTLITPMFAFSQCSAPIPDALESQEVIELMKGRSVVQIRAAFELLNAQKEDISIQVKPEDLGLGDSGPNSFNDFRSKGHE